MTDILAVQKNLHTHVKICPRKPIEQFTQPSTSPGTLGTTSFLFTNRNTFTSSSSIRRANALFPTRGLANANTVTGIGRAGKFELRIF